MPETHPLMRPRPGSAAASPRPTDITIRSPIRSASTPQGRTVASIPALTVASATPSWPSDRSNSDRRAGARIGTPKNTAEKLA